MSGERRHQAVLTAAGFRVRRIADGELVGGVHRSRMRALQAAADLDEATGLRCRRCGSGRINYERDAMLVAGVVELRDDILVLHGPAGAQAMDDVHLVCAECGEQLDGVEWNEEREEGAPGDGDHLSDADALDALAAKLNEPGQWNGGDVCELAAELLVRTGRAIDEETEGGSPC
jgi:DNA-directed RNA polymerase subunit RPC12/RpoP